MPASQGPWPLQRGLWLELQSSAPSWRKWYSPQEWANGAGVGPSFFLGGGRAMDNWIRILVDPQGTYADPDLEDHGPTTQPQVPPPPPTHTHTHVGPITARVNS